MTSLYTAGRHTILPAIDTFVPIEFGAFCSIASGLTIVSGQHPAVGHREAVSNFPFAEHGWGEYPPSKHDGRVIVGSDVWIGQGVTIMEGVQVGHGATIGAGSMVVKDVPPYAVVAGNPATVKKIRFGEGTVRALLGLQWWDWPDEKIKENLHDMRSVHFFVKHCLTTLAQGEPK